MNIALIGYGKMGHEIEKFAIQRGHKIVAAIDISNPEDFESEGFKSADVAIEFTGPKSAYNNYQKCFKYNIPIVSGSTGWLEKLDDIKQECKKGQTFFYSSNYSIGVNLFFELNKKLAKMMNDFSQYNPELKEIHHIHKLDAPSGTAITLAEDVIKNLERKESWVKETQTKDSEIAIKSERTGEVPGYHEIKYDSPVDTITIIHNAKSRAGFALGAVIAAEFTHGKKGFLSMSDMLKF